MILRKVDFWSLKIKLKVKEQQLILKNNSLVITALVEYKSRGRP